MKNRFPVLALTVMALIFLIAAIPASETQAKVAVQVQDVSLINLIATPEKYNSQIVRVSGYLSLDFEGRALYLGEADYDHGIYRNAVWVSFKKGTMSDDDLKSMHQRYVTLEGTFDSTHHGHMGLFSGSLNGIYRAWRRNEKQRN